MTKLKCIALAAAVTCSLLTAPASACDDRYPTRCDRTARSRANVAPAQAQPQQHTAAPTSGQSDITMRDVLRVIGNGLAGFAEGYNAARAAQPSVVIAPSLPAQQGNLPSITCTHQRSGNVVQTHCR